MDFQGWTFPTPDLMYTSTNANSPFATNVSNFFNRPSKIVKPHSRNASPRHGGRRRAASNTTVFRTRSLLDKQRSSNPQRYVARQQSQRPMSWHPNSYADFDTTQTMSNYLSYTSYPQLTYGAAAVNGIVTPMTYPLANEPQIQELIAPLEDLSAQEARSQYDCAPYGYRFWVAPDMDKRQPYAMDNMFPQQQVMPETWQYNSQYIAADTIPTAPTSPTFLPIQGAVDVSPLFLETATLPSNTEGEELVGMGLYDSPAEVQSSSLLFGGGWNGKARKRSLKLEESFEPATESSDADLDDDSDAEEELEDEEAEAVPDVVKLPFQQTHDMKPASSMAGQSFFFDSETDLNATAYATSMAYMPHGNNQPQFNGYGWV